MSKQIETDVCIVGSGVAGAIVARQCVDAGMRVVMIEAGRRANGRALGLRALERVLRDYRMARMGLWHRGAMYAKSDVLAPNYGLRGRALIVRGGTTLGWTGDAYRMLPEDFELRSRTGHGLDWPVNYDELWSRTTAPRKRYYASREIIRIPATRREAARFSSTQCPSTTGTPHS